MGVGGSGRADIDGVASEKTAAYVIDNLKQQINILESDNRDLRKMVTTIQSLQHVAVVGSCVAALCMEGCHAPVERYAVSIGLYAVYLVAFIAFYLRTYASAPRAKQA